MFCARCFVILMSGHSKWSKIKHEKEAKDIVKGNVFSKLSKHITLAVIEGGGITDPGNNIKLRLAIEKARSLNMPKGNIERAIEKGTGPEKSQLKEVVYEGFAPGGVAIIIVATTDNQNRTLSEIKSVVHMHGGKLGGPGSVSYLFKRCAVMRFNKEQISQDQVFSAASETEAFDVDEDEREYRLYFPYDHLGKIKTEFGGVKPKSIESIFKAESSITVDSGTAEKIQSLMLELESLDDVSGTYGNYQTA